MIKESLFIAGVTLWISLSLLYPYKYAGRQKKDFVYAVAAMLLLSPLLGYVIIKLFGQKKQTAS